MPFKHTILPAGLVLIDSCDITPDEEPQMLNNFGSINPFPSANHCSALKLKRQRLLGKITRVRRTNDAG